MLAPNSTLKPGAHQTDFRPSKAEEAGQNHNNSTTTLPRRPQGLLEAYTQSKGPSVDLFVQFTPVWTTFGTEKYPGVQQSDFEPSKAEKVGQNHNNSTTALPRWPQGLFVAYNQSKGLSVDLFVQFTPIWTVLAPKSTLEFSNLILNLQRQRRPAKP